MEEVIVALRGHVWDCVIDMLKDRDEGKEHAKLERTPMNQYPLHIAIEESTSSDHKAVVVFVSKSCSEARIFYVGTWHKNKKGKVARPNFCARWLERTTRARTYANSYCRAVQAAPDIVDALVESNPQAARSRARGLLPLHCTAAVQEWQRCP